MASRCDREPDGTSYVAELRTDYLRFLNFGLAPRLRAARISRWQRTPVALAKLQRLSSVRSSKRRLSLLCRIGLYDHVKVLPAIDYSSTYAF